MDSVFFKEVQDNMGNTHNVIGNGKGDFQVCNIVLTSVEEVKKFIDHPVKFVAETAAYKRGVEAGIVKGRQQMLEEDLTRLEHGLNTVHNL